MCVAGQGSRQIDVADFLHHMRDETIDHAKNVVATDERHFDVDLGEFRLSVGSQVFVTETASDLVVPIEAGHHQNLFVDLRRLRQRVKAARVDSTGDQIIAGSFRSAAAEHRSFDFEEFALVKIIANGLSELMADKDVLLQSFAAQVDKAILESQLFVRQFRPFDFKRRRPAGTEYRQFVSSDFDIAGVEFRIDQIIPAIAHFPFDLHDVLASQSAGDRIDLAVFFGIEDELCLAVAVSEVHENEVFAVVAITVNPAAECDRLVNMIAPQFAAGVSSMSGLGNGHNGGPKNVPATGTKVTGSRPAGNPPNFAL